MADVFLSYSRVDKEFVQLLDRRLRKRARDTWVDWEKIRPAEEFMAAIYSAIESAQAFVFIISPDSIASEVCHRELAHAVEHNKRLIPVVCREVSATMVPPALRSLNWILFLDRDRFERSVQLLESAVDTDLAWVRMHTRLLMRAIEWKENDRRESLLLRGGDLTAAEQALADSVDKEPEPTRLQRAYVKASRDAATRDEDETRAQAHLKEAQARIKGELETARRIQMGTFPNAAAFSDEKRFSLFAFTEPAREVGGDLYDFFRLDDDRLMLLIGDVSGKGLPISLFMAASKALIKSAALRHGGDVGTVMQDANREIARDNSESLFVTLFAGVLDARSGQLEYCSAGFEPAYVLSGKRAVSRLSGETGPPLSVIDDFRYQANSYRMCPGEKLCLMTDGVLDAVNRAGLTYGQTRLEEALAGLHRATGASEVGEAIRRDVTAFTAETEPVDDATILVLCWH